MTRKMLVLGAGLLACLLVAPILAAGTRAALPPRDLTIVGGQWTWASGSNRTAESEPFGVYGTKGVAAPDNVPGTRYGSVSWTNASGSAWLFGGEGYAEATSGFLNDLWKWDGTTWTWVSGSKEVDQVSVYGAKGVAAPGNVPGARFGSVSWTDANENLWLFGGEEVRLAQLRVSQCPLEVGWDELDLGERVGRAGPIRDLRHEGRSGVWERARGEAQLRLLDGCKRGASGFSAAKDTQPRVGEISTICGNGTGRTGPG